MPATDPDAQRQFQKALAQGLSHDLRAPLRAIDSFASLLEQDQGRLDGTGREHLRRIRDAAQRMGTLLDALQELSAAERDPLRLVPVDLSLLADWSAAELQDAVPERKFQIRVQPDLQVEGDEHYLKRMLARLLDNARRFTASDPVEIDVDGEQDEDRLTLRIRDRGIGFDMRYADKLFQPFQRLHRPDEGAGAGLGLAIAQCIAQRHGGGIRAESAVGAGSTFYVDIPLRQTGTDQHDKRGFSRQEGAA